MQENYEWVIRYDSFYGGMGDDGHKEFSHLPCSLERVQLLLSRYKVNYGDDVAKVRFDTQAGMWQEVQVYSVDEVLNM